MCGYKGRLPFCTPCQESFEEYKESRQYQWDLEEEAEFWLRQSENHDEALEIVEKELRDTDLYEFFFGDNREAVVERVKANVLEQAKNYVEDTVEKAWWNGDDVYL